MARHDDIDPIVARRQERQRRSQLRLLLVLAGLAVGGLLVTAVVVGFVLSRNGATVPVKIPGVIGVSEGREGETWTHAELEKYLAEKGMKLERIESFSALGVNRVKYKTQFGTLSVNAARDTREAKTSAAVGYKDENEKAAYVKSWGRFVFSGKQAAVDGALQILQ